MTIFCAFPSIGSLKRTSIGLFTPEAKRVHAIGKTPSGATSAEVDKACLVWPVYRHWLAAELHYKFHQYDENKSECTINKQKITYDSALIKTFVDKFQRIVRRRINNKCVPELVLTSLLSQIFKELLSLNLLEGNISCGHQYPIYGNAERGDIMISEMNQELEIVRTFLIGDMKPAEITDSLIESLAYGSRTARIAADFSVQLILAYTCYECLLYLAQSANQKLVLFEICRVSVPVTSQMEQFAFTLLLGIKYLIADTTIYTSPLYNPLPDICVSQDDIFGSRYRTFKHGNQVYKCFVPKDEVKTGEKDNIEVIKSLGEKLDLDDYFEELSLESFCEVKYMKYKYIQAVNVPPSCTQIAQLALILEALHELGYVHSDIREDNIIIAENGRPYIIDFDMVDLEDTKYPPQYNNISERHPAAKKNKPRKKEHDVYSFKKLIESWTGYTVTANSLKDIAEQMSSPV